MKMTMIVIRRLHIFAFFWVNCYHINKSPCADYRRVFSNHKVDRNDILPRKQQLGPFFPPQKPTTNDAKIRYENSESYFRSLADIAWKDCASVQRTYKYDAMRKKINIDAIREKFNQKKQPPKKIEIRKSSSSKIRYGITKSTDAGDEDSSDQTSGDETYARLQEEYLSNLPSTSVSRTNPAFIRKNLHKKAKHSSKNTPLKDEESEFSYLDETVHNQSVNEKRKKPKKL
uniref:Uncharacterized protein n=1 Tax=Panagrolaimus superbus TaxID=310955 RepID=A0A914XVH4_9BILA